MTRPFKCPLCGLPMVHRGWQAWAHQKAAGGFRLCILEGCGIVGEEQVAQWNQRATELIPAADWRDEDGAVLWWIIDPETGAPREAPWVGSPLCLGTPVEVHCAGNPEPIRVARFDIGGWIEGTYTHFSRLPTPRLADKGETA